MPYGLYTRSIGQAVSLALMPTSPTTQAYVACFVTSAQGMSVPAEWIDVYRRAYEEARAALEPSRFQVMLQPCWN